MRILSVLLPALFLFSACQQEEVTEITENEPEFEEAIAVIHPTEGNDVSGTVRFTQTNDGILVEADISGLESESMHGFHIHEYGDCSADDATSAGGHYNPNDSTHGAPEDDERHVGDLGNIEAHENGEATYSRVDNVIEFSGTSNILGRAVVIHAGQDDLQSQPTGDAGNRLGCGVIGVANPES